MTAKMVGSHGDGAVSLSATDARILELMARRRVESMVREELSHRFNQLWSREKLDRNETKQTLDRLYSAALRQARAASAEQAARCRAMRAHHHQLAVAGLCDALQRKQSRMRAVRRMVDSEKAWQRQCSTARAAGRARLAAERRAAAAATESEQQADCARRLQHSTERAHLERHARIHFIQQRVAWNNAQSLAECTRAGLSCSADARPCEREAARAQRAACAQRRRDASRERLRCSAELAARCRQDVKCDFLGYG